MEHLDNSGAQDYGPVLKTSEAEEIVMNAFRMSREEKLAGRKGFPVCAWGPPGIGKTEFPNMIIKKYADFFGGDSKKGIPGNIVYVPIAQIEEKARNFYFLALSRAIY